MAALLLAAPLSAQVAPAAPDLTKLTDAQLRARMRESERSSEAETTCAGVPYAEELARRYPENRNVGHAAFRRGLCALRSDRPADALRDLELAEGLAGAWASASGRVFLDRLALIAARQTDNWAALEEHSLHIVARADADEFADLDPDLWLYLLRTAPPANEGRIALAFVGAPVFDRLDSRMQEIMAYRAIEPALAANNTALALKLATREPSPYSMITYLIDRRYVLLWPKLEAHVGPRMERELRANLAKAERELTAEPGDLKKLTEVVQALTWLGEPTKAVERARTADHSETAFFRATEQFAWLINAEVKALDRIGQMAQADALFDRLAELDADAGRGWMVNFTINRADRLVGQGRWVEALPAAELAVQVAAKHGSDYAKTVAAVNRYCAAIKLDPPRTELADWWKVIEAGRIDNIGAAVQAAQCKGDDAAARRFIREGLENEESRPQALRMLQRRPVDLFRDEGNMFAEPRLLMLSDPALLALFRKYGRDLPKALEPAT